MPDGGANAVVAGTYSDLKLIRTRSTVQMIIEMPIERAEELVQKFGIPQPGQEIHVAVARLQVPAPNARPQETERSLSAGAAPARAHKSAEAKERYQQQDELAQACTRAGMLSQDARFQSWVDGKWTSAEGTVRSRGSEGAAAYIRRCCGVLSRSEIAAGGRAYERFLALETEWKQASGQMAEAR